MFQLPIIMHHGFPTPIPLLLLLRAFGIPIVSTVPMYYEQNSIVSSSTLLSTNHPFGRFRFLTYPFNIFINLSNRYIQCIYDAKQKGIEFLEAQDCRNRRSQANWRNRSTAPGRPNQAENQHCNARNRISVLSLFFPTIGILYRINDFLCPFTSVREQINSFKEDCFPFFCVIIFQTLSLHQLVSKLGSFLIRCRQGDAQPTRSKQKRYMNVIA